MLWNMNRDWELSFRCNIIDRRGCVVLRIYPHCPLSCLIPSGLVLVGSQPSPRCIQLKTCSYSQDREHSLSSSVRLSLPNNTYQYLTQPSPPLHAFPLLLRPKKRRRRRRPRPPRQPILAHRNPHSTRHHNLHIHPSHIPTRFSPAASIPSAPPNLQPHLHPHLHPTPRSRHPNHRFRPRMLAKLPAQRTMGLRTRTNGHCSLRTFSITADTRFLSTYEIPTSFFTSCSES